MSWLLNLFDGNAEDQNEDHVVTAAQAAHAFDHRFPGAAHTVADEVYQESGTEWSLSRGLQQFFWENPESFADAPPSQSGNVDTVVLQSFTHSEGRNPTYLHPLPEHDVLQVATNEPQEGPKVEAVPVMTRDVQHPRAKKALRKVLPVWENPEDEDEVPNEYAGVTIPSGARSSTRRPSGWNPFLSLQETKEADGFLSGLRRVEVVRENSTNLEHLSSYESRILGIPIGIAGEEHDPPPRDDPGMIGDIELRFTGPWSISPGATWTVGRDFAEFKGSGKEPSLAVFDDKKLSMTHFEFEASFVLCKAIRFGLAFRVDEAEFFAYKVDCRSQTLQIHRGARPSNELEPLHVSVGSASAGAPTLQADRWHRLRVTCLGKSLTFYLDRREVGQCSAPQVERHIVFPSVSKHRRSLPIRRIEGQVFFKDLTEEHAGVRAGDEIIEVNGKFSAEEIVEEVKRPSQLRITARCMPPGLLGLWIGKTGAVQVKDISVSNLTAYEQELWQGRLKVQSERRARQQEELLMKASDRRLEKAVNLVQCVARMRQNSVKQRMAVYDDAKEIGEEHGNEMRQKTLLKWLQALAFLNKVDKVLHEPSIFGPLYQQHLQTLDAECPPPPPPPQDDPPSLRDLDLQRQYALKRAVFAHRAQATALKALGLEKFVQMRNVSGPALDQKRSIARKWYERAMQATSEQDHLDYLRKAYCLENDHDSIEEADTEDFAKWIEEKEKQADQAAQRRSRREATKATIATLRNTGFPVGSPTHFPANSPASMCGSSPVFFGGSPSCMPLGSPMGIPASSPMSRYASSPMAGYPCMTPGSARRSRAGMTPASLLPEDSPAMTKVRTEPATSCRKHS